jgi:NADH dehydrogenase [ubiquinone] 1 alpha subcomplex assembly factor 1
MEIFTFTKEEVNQWEIENDTIMGGKSSSKIDYINEDDSYSMKFTGHVSLENNGGFAQTQRVYDTNLDLSSFSQVIIFGRGDGKTYNIRFETNEKGVSYESDFKAEGNFEAHIKFVNLKKFFHGEPVPEKPEFDKSNIKSVFFLIGNGVEEDFTISINKLVAVN